MIELRKNNYNDIEQQYHLIKSLPETENGFMNSNYNISIEEYKNKILPTEINHSNGIDVEKDKVPDTRYFLYDNNEIIGIFKIRHYLNETLKNGSGHLGFSILPKYRNKGYATKGLKLAIEECKKLIKEDEIYMSVQKNNSYSLKAQINNGAYIHHEDNKRYYTRIKIRNNSQ